MTTEQSFERGPKGPNGETPRTPTHVLQPGETQERVTVYGKQVDLIVLSGTGEASFADSNVVPLFEGRWIPDIYTNCSVTNTGDVPLVLEVTSAH